MISKQQVIMTMLHRVIRVVSYVAICLSLISIPWWSSQMQYHSVPFCPPPGAVIITVSPGGRLGNQVWEYLSLWGVAKYYTTIEKPVWPLVPRQIVTTLSKVYTGIKIPVLEDIHLSCPLPKYDIQQIKKNTKELDAVQMKECIENAIAGDIVLLRKYEVARFILRDMVQEMRQELSIKSELLAHAQETLRQTRLKLIAKLQIEGNNVTKIADEFGPFVGIHVRRTDYMAYLAKRKPSVNPVDANFFIEASKKMRDILQTTDYRPPIFVVVSDDHRWCEEELEPKIPDLIVAGTGDISDPVSDLVLLSACNHTIFDYGTYGLTAACFTGGYSIKYSGNPKNSCQLFSPNNVLDF